MSKKKVEFEIDLADMYDTVWDSVMMRLNSVVTDTEQKALDDALRECGYVKERTCTVVEALCRGLDESLNDYELSCGHYVVHFVKPSFCVECGARVVG